MSENGLNISEYIRTKSEYCPAIVQLQIDVVDFGGELAKDFVKLQPYAEKLIARLRQVGGEMNVGAAGTLRRAQEGFSDVMKEAKVKMYPLSKMVFSMVLS